MALTLRYANFDLATGSNDGTSEANAWQTWSAMASGYAAGQKIYFKQTSSRHDAGGTIQLTTAVTQAGPVICEGYKTTPGDGGDDGESNYFQFSNQLESVRGIRFLYFDYEGSPAATNQYPFKGYSSQLGPFTLYRCRFKNLRNDSTVPLIAGDDSSEFIGCTFIPGQGQAAVWVTDSGLVESCRIDMRASGASGIRFNTNWIQYAYVIRNTILGAGSGAAIFSDTYDPDAMSYNRQIIQNSIYNVGTGIELAGGGWLADDGVINIIGNVIYGCSYGIRNLGAHSAGSRMFFNAIGNAATARYAGFGKNQCDIGDLTLTANPFNDPSNWDFTLNVTAGGGASIAQVFLTDPVMDGSTDNLEHYGAAQSQIDNVAVAVGADSLAITGQQVTPNVTSGGDDVIVSVGSDALVLSGQQITPSADWVVAMGADALVLSGQQVSLSLDQSPQVGSDSLALSGQQVSLSLDRSIQVGGDALVLSGQQVELSLDHVAQIGADALTLSGQQVTPSADAVRSVGSDALSIAGQQIALSLDRRPSVGSDALSLSGQQVSLSLDWLQSVGNDALSLSGQQVTPLVTSGDDAITQVGAGSLALTGQQPALSLDAVAQVGADALVLSGQQVALSVDTVAQIGNDALVLSGQQIALSVDAVAQVGSDSLAITGQQPAVITTTGGDAVTQVGADALVLSGQAPSLEVGNAISVGSDALVLTGQQVTPSTWTVPSVGNDALAISGQQISITLTDGIYAQVGADALVLVGQAPTLITDQYLETLAGSLLLSGQTVTAFTQQIRPAAAAGATISVSANVGNRSVDADISNRSAG